MRRGYLVNGGYGWLYSFGRLLVNEKIAQKILLGDAINGVTPCGYGAQCQLSAIFADCKPRAIDHNARRYGKLHGRIVRINGNLYSAAIVADNNRLVKLSEKVVRNDVTLDCYIVRNSVGVACGQRL